MQESGSGLKTMGLGVGLNQPTAREISGDNKDRDDLVRLGKKPVLKVCQFPTMCFTL